MNLFLDDIRVPHKVKHVELPFAQWKVVRNFTGFCHAINHHFQLTNELPNFISFDHDLSDKDALEFERNPHHVAIEKTGMDCAKWLVEFCQDHNLKMCNFMVHSMNPVGKSNIENLLNNFVEFQNKG